MRPSRSPAGWDPSSRAVSPLNLLRLAEMLDQKEFRDMAEKTLAAFGPRLNQTPGAMPQMMVAFEFHLSKPKQIVIAGKPEAGDTRAMLGAIHGEFIPNKILLLADGAERQAFLGKHLEFIQGVKPVEGKATAYVCENYVCRLPTTDISTMKSQLTRRETEQPPTKG